MQIREIRTRLGLQQNQMARIFGVTPAWWSRIENGERDVPWATPMILDLLDQDPGAVAELLDRDWQSQDVPQFVHVLAFLLNRRPDGTEWLAERLGHDHAQHIAA